MWPYTKAELDDGDPSKNGIGRMQMDQLSTSILNTPGNAVFRNATFAQILRHPSLGSIGGSDPVAAAQAGTAQGSYILFSAGPDGVYFSRQDGPGTPQDPIDDIITETDPDYSNPIIVKEYDDIRVFGGG